MCSLVTVVDNHGLNKCTNVYLADHDWCRWNFTWAFMALVMVRWNDTYCIGNSLFIRYKSCKQISYAELTRKIFLQQGFCMFFPFFHLEPWFILLCSSNCALILSSLHYISVVFIFSIESSHFVTLWNSFCRNQLSLIALLSDWETGVTFLSSVFLNMSMNWKCCMPWIEISGNLTFMLWRFAAISIFAWSFGFPFDETPSVVFSFVSTLGL